MVSVVCHVLLPTIIHVVLWERKLWKHQGLTCILLSSCISSPFARCWTCRIHSNLSLYSGNVTGCGNSMRCWLWEFATWPSESQSIGSPFPWEGSLGSDTDPHMSLCSDKELALWLSSQAFALPGPVPLAPATNNLERHDQACSDNILLAWIIFLAILSLCASGSKIP